MVLIIQKPKVFSTPTVFNYNHRHRSRNFQPYCLHAQLQPRNQLFYLIFLSQIFYLIFLSQISISDFYLSDDSDRDHCDATIVLIAEFFWAIVAIVAIMWTPGFV